MIQKISETDNRREVEQAARDCLAPEICDYIEKCKQDSHPAGQLIAVLHRVQAKYGYLDRKHLDAVGQLLGVPTAKVSGVASFYHFFRLNPTGKHVISLCLGTACYVKGADLIAQRLTEELGITFGETSTDGMFSLEGTRCLGTCGLAPVMTIGEDVHANVTPEQIPVILNEYIQRERQEKQETA
ncbi:MAG: NADH-quinone oxidoreductase subunit NuoE [Planctomycetia bacterium]|jgi:NADH:ubiquinone oxidoreductase subunit E